MSCLNNEWAEKSQNKISKNIFFYKTRFIYFNYLFVSLKEGVHICTHIPKYPDKNIFKWVIVINRYHVCVWVFLCVGSFVVVVITCFIFKSFSKLLILSCWGWVYASVMLVKLTQAKAIKPNQTLFKVTKATHDIN